MIEALVAAGAGPGRPDGRHGWTPLLHAVHKRRTGAAAALLAAGAAVDQASPGGVTPLIMAAAYGDLLTVRLLLDAGADPRRQAAGGVTAIANAAGGGGLFDVTDGSGLGTCHPDTVRILLARAPDLRADDPGPGRLARWLARGRGCDEVRTLLARN